MPTVHDAVDSAISEVTIARTLVSKVTGKQVRGVDVVAMLKSTSYAWFQTHRPIIVAGAATADLAAVDLHFTTVLDSTAKYAAKKTYLDALRDAKQSLLMIRAALLVPPIVAPTPNTDDLAPDFSPLAGDQVMRDILTRRWHECSKCVKADAHLAAIVMMGGLLEALFVAWANKMPDKKPLVNATSAPKDKTSGKTINYQEWMLDSYIKVGFELKWLTESAKTVADVLKEYRNYVHPEKERRHGVVLKLNDSSMFWQVTKALARQLLLMR